MSVGKDRSVKPDFDREIFEKYYNYVYTIVFNRLRNVASTEDIEDCVGDIFSDIYIHYEYNEKYDDIKGFIITVSERKAVDLFRRLTTQNKHTVTADENTINGISDVTSVDEHIERTELSRILFEYISNLGEPDSVIIMQKYYYNRNATEISRIVAMKPSAVRKRCSRALKKLRQQLNDDNIFI